MNASEIHKESGTSIGSDKYRAFTIPDIEKIIADAKAESKGVCEWKIADKHYSFEAVTSCQNRYCFNYNFEKDGSNNFCPGCGKEIKVV